MAKRIADNIDKLPPHNKEAEQAVLGSLLLDRDAIYKIADILRTKDFYHKNHQVIYDAILHLYQNQEPIDIVNLSNRLKSIEALEEIGGGSYLTSLVNSISSPTNIASHAKIVQYEF